MPDLSLKHSYITLPAGMNREVRHLGIERDLSLNDIIVVALRQYLDSLKPELSANGSASEQP